MHLNDLALKNIGFNLVAMYECTNYKKGERPMTIWCYQNNTNGNYKKYLVRFTRSNGHLWDIEYNSKEDANLKVNQLIGGYKHYKRIR